MGEERSPEDNLAWVDPAASDSVYDFCSNSPRLWSCSSTFVEYLYETGHSLLLNVVQDLEVLTAGCHLYSGRLLSKQWKWSSPYALSIDTSSLFICFMGG